MITQTALLNALAAHQGSGAGITACNLARQLDIAPRTLRHLISRARDEEGFAICGTPSTGYYMATTAEELHSSCEFLIHRAMKSLTLASRMRKVSLAVLAGQLLLTQG